MDERAWLHKSAEILTNIKTWRQAHPIATFVEIEDEVHRRMMQLEAQILQEAAQASANREWGKYPNSQPPCVLPAPFPYSYEASASEPYKVMAENASSWREPTVSVPSADMVFFPSMRSLACCQEHWLLASRSI
ncbi:hypothetical protein [Ktedonospora formicarum]|uniref:Uncharacterized protein n=1 Tax=Ktedonospora formicarum TaxID=2778364 RepID=A0A8J3I9Q6_9CHLR|nr:hypothetical protein [Ktedonospora formicarum]GHO48577.1 hypothetical protein KSX_67400 [Ktedonospora formicarum]